MYMAPIVRAKPPVSLARRRAVGTALVLFGMAVMLPWLALFGAIGLASATLRGLIALPTTFKQLIDHVGDHAFGL